MPKDLTANASEWCEEALDIHGVIYEKMTRVHRRARMTPEDHIILDSKLIGTAGSMAATIISRGSLEGMNDLTVPTEQAIVDQALEWIESLISLHANIYTMMVKNYRRARISPEDETMLDVELFKSAATMANALFSRGRGYPITQ